MELFQDKKDKKDCTLDMGRGCEFCGCGSEELSAGVCEGCFKLHVTDWLKDYPDTLPGDIYEVRFKNTRRGYYQNVNGLSLKEGDIVAVEAAPGHDIGIVSLSGDMVARQMRRVGFNPQNGEFKKIYRKAKPYDIEKWQEAIALEHGTMIKARQIAAEMNLNMKIGDVEYQGDKIKAIFYYIADERVDFRELIKVFAEVFHIRVEMKQIGARQEAGRIGGIGSCGRELCCASWISSFMSVTTNAARTQDISLNPQKLAGQCSKLKCCLVYEYDDYMDARKEFPRVSEPLQALDGDYYFVKNDILARTMSFSSAPGSMAGLVSLPVERVREIMKMNARGIKPDRLEAAGAAPAALWVIIEPSIEICRQPNTSSVLPQEPAAKSCGTTVGTTAAAREVTAGRTVRTGLNVRHPTGRKAVVITVAATGRRVRNSRENPLPVRSERRTVLPVRSSVPPKGPAAKVRGATAETTAAAREATAGRTVRTGPSVRHPTGRKAAAITVAATGRRV